MVFFWAPVPFSSTNFQLRRSVANSRVGRPNVGVWELTAGVVCGNNEFESQCRQNLEIKPPLRVVDPAII